MSIRDMVARHSDYQETNDFIPTPPWATRALYEYVAPGLRARASSMSAWDPACGQGHMLKVFDEYGHPLIKGSDIVIDHEKFVHVGSNTPAAVFVLDYIDDSIDAPPETADVIVTNPPYKHAEKFITESLLRARFGVGMLLRVQALETQGRYSNIYSYRPPTQVAFFSDRISFKTGKVVKKAPKMFFHTWLWWEKSEEGQLLPPRPPMWIPPNAQQLLEKDSDYE